MKFETIARCQVSTGRNMPRNTDEQVEVGPSPTMYAATPSNNDILSPPDRGNLGSNLDVLRSEVFMQQLNLALTADRTERDTPIEECERLQGQISKYG